MARLRCCGPTTCSPGSTRLRDGGPRVALNPSQEDTVPGPPSGNESYVVSISFPGPLKDSELKKVRAEIKKCLKHLRKVQATAVVQEEKIAPRR